MTTRHAAVVAVTVALSTLPLVSCGSEASTVVEGDAERVVTLTDGITESVFALGLGDLVVGRDISSTLAEAADLPIVTNDHEVNPEALLAVRPTLVLIDEDTGPETAIDQIESMGVRVETIQKATEVDQIVPRLREVAALFGVEDRAERLASEIESDLAEVADLPSTGVRVAFVYVRGPAGVYLMGGPGAGPASLIEAAGAIDAGTAIGLELPFTPLTPEAMVEAAPDVLLVTTTGLDSVSGVDGLLDLAGVAQTPAGKNRRVITVEDGLLFSFGPRTPGLVQSLHDEIARLMTENAS